MYNQMKNNLQIQMRIAEVENNIRRIIENRKQALKTPFFERDQNLFIFWHMEERVNRAIVNELNWFTEEILPNEHSDYYKNLVELSA